MNEQTYSHTDEIARANKTTGNHWFDKDTMRWFDSKVYGSVHYGRYFISSEVPPYSRRRYTIRYADECGRIETIGEVAKYATYTAASKALDKMIATGDLTAYADGIIDNR